MQTFQDKVALITGGASGIGKALCERLASAGAKVIIADINLAGAQALALSLGAEARELDVSNQAQLETLIKACFERYGRLDYLFNNAGIGVTGDARDLDQQLWREAVEINLMGVVYGCQAAYPLMVRQGSGHIINIASLAGLIGFPGMLPYATTKAAVVGLSRTLRVEASQLGVKVSVVCPGFIDSKIFESSRCANLKPSNLRNIISLPIMDVETAAAKILQGVLANREVIVFPGYARVLWAIYSFAPGLIGRLGHEMLNKLRKLRLES
jgi:NAD(P)-dependent dehydrogenase (short-subunit alcohol dehydrogenase family)